MQPSAESPVSAGGVRLYRPSLACGGFLWLTSTKTNMPFPHAPVTTLVALADSPVVASFPFLCLRDLRVVSPFLSTLALSLHLSLHQRWYQYRMICPCSDVLRSHVLRRSSNMPSSVGELACSRCRRARGRPFVELILWFLGPFGVVVCV
jgi:hypothetical protein